jgi:serine/threonine-protein kinase
VLGEAKTVPSDPSSRERRNDAEVGQRAEQTLAGGVGAQRAAAPEPRPNAPAPVARAARQPPPTVAERPGSPPIPLPSIDGFGVHERIGQGGMGEVFRCTRRRDSQPLAVKVLSQSLAVVPDYVKRFEREAAAMAQLDHPGIVRLLDRGRSLAHCWIAMELIDGVSLRIHAHQSRPSPRALAKLLSQIAHALAYAHARGVVHRDLKPDNVLVQPDLKTKVLDFGLAGLYVAGAECLTMSNVAMGTANYMAPEQRKDAKHVDHRADLYSFGVMTYELLTGELPVGRFPAPSKVVPGLDPAWDALVERCLELEPSKRPHSAMELAHQLDGMISAAPPMELAPRTKRKAAATSRFWSWMGLGAGVALILGVAGLRVASDHGHRSPPRLSAAASGSLTNAGRTAAPSRLHR